MNKLLWFHCRRINCRAFQRLLTAMTDQLHEMEKVMLQHLKGTTLLVPEPLHFLLPEPNGLVTVVYPAGVPDSQLEMRRQVRLFLHPIIPITFQTTLSSHTDRTEHELMVSQQEVKRAHLTYRKWIACWCSKTTFSLLFSHLFFTLGVAPTVWFAKWQAIF